MNIKETVEFCWQHEACIRQAIEDKRNDCGTVSHGGGGHCKMSDPTALKAIANISDVACVEVEYGPAINGKRNIKTLKRPLQWLKVAQWTKDYYASKPQGELIDLKYKQSKLRNEICSVLGVSQARYYTMLSDIFTYASGLARGMGIK